MFRLMVLIALAGVSVLFLSAAPDYASAQKAIHAPASLPPRSDPLSPSIPLPPALPDAKLDLPPNENCTPERKIKGECGDTAAAAPLMGSPTTPPPMFGPGKR